MARSERSDSAQRKQNWRWKCQMCRRSRTFEESWTCAVTVENWRTSTAVTHRCSALVNRETQGDAHALHLAGSTGINMGFMPSTRDARAGTRVRLRRQHRRRSNDEEHPEQHKGVMTRPSVKVCRAHQYRSSRMLTTSPAVCREP